MGAVVGEPHRSPERALQPPDEPFVVVAVRVGAQLGLEPHERARCSAVSRVGTRTSTATSRSPCRPVSSDGMPRRGTTCTAPG